MFLAIHTRSGAAIDLIRDKRNVSLSASKAEDLTLVNKKIIFKERKPIVLKLARRSMKSAIINLMLFTVMLAIPDAYSKELTSGVVIDFLDTAYYLKEGDYISKEEIHERIKKLAAAGVKKFYFRSAPGVAYYPSKVLRMYSGDGRDQIKEERLIKSINNYDVLKEFIKACKEFKIKIYYWEPIFDNEIAAVHYSPKSPEGKKFGEYPIGDDYFAANRQLYMKHRFADKYPESQTLGKTIGKIALISDTNRKTRLTKNDIEIYTGDKQSYPPLRKYDKAYNFRVSRINGKTAIILENLDIKSPIIKIKQNITDKKYTFVIDFSQEWCWVYDKDGKRVKMPLSGTSTSGEDLKPSETIFGSNAPKTAWDCRGRSLIIKLNEFDRYAGGMPCYALRKSRDRRLAIAKEILTNYPDIDGIAYSMRTHSTPQRGNMKGIGKIAFGFNKIIVDEYQKRYGMNILKEDFDVEKFLKLRGDYFTEFIGEAGKLIHSFGKKFEVQAVPDGSKVAFCYNRHMWDGYTINNFFQIDKWAKDGYVDTVMISSSFGYYGKWTPEWNNQIAQFHKLLKGTKTKLAFMVKVKKGCPGMPYIKNIASNKMIDEIVFYEEEFVYKQNLYDFITDIVKKANQTRDVTDSQ